MGIRRRRSPAEQFGIRYMTSAAWLAGTCAQKHASSVTEIRVIEKQTSSTQNDESFSAPNSANIMQVSPSGGAYGVLVTTPGHPAQKATVQKLSSMEISTAAWCLGPVA